MNVNLSTHTVFSLLVATLSVDSVLAQSPNASLSASESKWRIAVRRLEQLGGRTRELNKPGHPDHTMFISLARAPRSGTSVTAFNDDAMMPVRIVSLNVKTGLFLHNTAVTHLGLRKLRGTRLCALTLDGQNVNDQSLKELHAIPGLKMLSISSSSVTDSGLRHLIGCESLESLSLSGVSFSKKQLRHIGRLSKLKNLILGGDIGDEAIVCVNALPNLEDLHVPHEATVEFFRKLKPRPLAQARESFSSQ